MARSSLVPLLIVGALAVGAFVFWNPTICSQLNTIGGTGFDFCSFRSTGDLAHPFQVPLPKGFHHHRHFERKGTPRTPQDIAHFQAAVAKGGLDITSDPLTAKASLAEMVDYRMSI